MKKSKSGNFKIQKNIITSARRTIESVFLFCLHVKCKKIKPVADRMFFNQNGIVYGNENVYIMNALLGCFKRILYMFIFFKTIFKTDKFDHFKEGYGDILSNMKGEKIHERKSDKRRNHK